MAICGTTRPQLDHYQTTTRPQLQKHLKQYVARTGDSRKLANKCVDYVEIILSRGESIYFDDQWSLLGVNSDSFSSSNSCCDMLNNGLKKIEPVYLYKIVVANMLTLQFFHQSFPTSIECRRNSSSSYEQQLQGQRSQEAIVLSRRMNQLLRGGRSPGSPPPHLPPLPPPGSNLLPDQTVQYGTWAVAS